MTTFDIPFEIRQALLETRSDGHREQNPHHWHPSAIAKLPECPRQAVLRKLDLQEIDATTAGVFHSGTLTHEWLERVLADRLPDTFRHEPDKTMAVAGGGEDPAPGITVKGRADLVDTENGVVYDFKTTGKTGHGGGDTRYPEDFLEDRDHTDYVDQLTVYMRLFDAQKGRLVYLHKMDLQPLAYPQDGYVGFDHSRWDELVGAARAVSEKLLEYVDPDTGLVDRREVLIDVKSEAVFPKCDQESCWDCKRYETLKDPDEVGDGG